MARDIESYLELLHRGVETALGAVVAVDGDGADLGGFTRIETDDFVEFLSEVTAGGNVFVALGVVFLPQVLHRHEHGMATGDFAVENVLGVVFGEFVFPSPNSFNPGAPFGVAATIGGQIDDVPERGYYFGFTTEERADADALDEVVSSFESAEFFHGGREGGLFKPV